MRQHFLALALLAAVAAPAGAQKADRDWAGCNRVEKAYRTASDDMEVERGCTAVLALGERVKQADRAVAFNNRGVARHSRGQFDLAIQDFDQAIKLAPKHTYAYSNRASALRRKGEFDKALQDAETALEVSPRKGLAHSARGFILMDKGDLDGAIAAFDAALAAEPKLLHALNSRGRTRHFKRQYEAAIADFDRALKIEPKFVYSYLNRSDAERALGRLDDAMKDADEAIRRDPGYASAFNMRGLVFAERKELDRAIRDYDEAIRLDPKLPHAFNNRGFAREQKGDFAGAIGDYKQTLAVDPGHRFARANLTRAEKMLASLAEARARMAASRPGGVVTPPAAAAPSAAPGRPVAPVGAPPAPAAPAAIPRLPPPSAETRVALVIGNASYRSLGRLANSTADARAVAKLLREAGFRVFEHVDVGRATTLDAIDEFRKASAAADTAFIYYAGHGFEAAGRNMIAPVDSEVDCQNLEVSRAVALDDLLAASQPKRNRIVVLDSCRNNPFPACVRDSAGGARGFRSIEIAQRGDLRTLVFNATAPGGLASDGPVGGHSPFAKSLIARLKSAPLSRFRDVFDLVAEDVMAATSNAQIPESTARGPAPIACLAGAGCN